MSPIRFVAFLFAFVSSVFAYTIETPNQTEGWTNQGPQILTWQRVSSDRLNFTVLLVNQQQSSYSPQVLASSVDGTLGKLSINSPSGGWPNGSDFQVNLVQDSNDLSAILAQSTQFNITVTAPLSTTSTQTSASSSATQTTSKSAGTSTFSIQTGLLTLLSLIGFAFA